MPLILSSVYDKIGVKLSCVDDKINEILSYMDDKAGGGMNHSIIKQVIFDQIELIREIQITGRSYSFEKNMNYILVGLRRAGKSTLLYKLAREKD